MQEKDMEHYTREGHGTLKEKDMEHYTREGHGTLCKRRP